MAQYESGHHSGAMREIGDDCKKRARERREKEARKSTFSFMFFGLETEILKSICQELKVSNKENLKTKKRI